MSFCIAFGVTLLSLTAFTSTAHPAESTEPETEAPIPTEQDQEIKPVPERTPLIDLSRQETDDLRLLYFDPAETYLTPYVGRNFTKALQYYRDMLGWQPWDKTTLLLKDFSDYGNAAARASPNNAMLFDIAPLSLAFDTFSPGERFFTLTNHEVTHVAQMDVWNERDAFWRRLFGGKPLAVQEHPESILYNYLTTPRANVPRWFLEGSAVFMETWMAGGFGRAQGAYDEMVFRSMVRDGSRFYSPLGLESEGTSVDFQVGVNDYLYGTRFFSWLALTYGPEKVVLWLRRDKDSAAYYSVAFKKVFGLGLNAAWSKWIDWEKEFQRQNLAEIRAYPLTEQQPISRRGLGSVSRIFVQPGSGDIIGAFRFPGVIAHLGILDRETGDIRKLKSIKGPMLYRVTSLAYDPEQNKIWYTPDNYAYRDIIEIDLDSGVSKMALKDARIGDLVFNPGDETLWGLRHLNGYVTLVRLPPPYDSWNQVHTFDFGRTIFDLDISRDGSLLSASVGEIDGQQSVQIFKISDLLAGKIEFYKKFKMGASTPEGFSFSPDGNFLYGSSYYNGVSNIVRYDIASEDVATVTNSDTGLFRPVSLEDGSLIALSYSGDGLTPVQLQPLEREDLNSVRFLGAEIARKHPIVQEWGVGSPNDVNFEELITGQGKYHPGDEMKLGGIYPIVEGYRGKVALGGFLVIEDPLQFSQFKAAITISGDKDGTSNENLHVDLEYKTLNWRFRYWHNDADFYDLFGPTKRARAGDAISVGYHKSILYDPPRKLEVTADLAAYGGLDTLPSAQDVGTGFSRLATFRTGLNYSNTTKSLGAIDAEKGWRWNINSGADYASDDLVGILRGGIEAGTPLPLKNSSIWLYSSAGTIFGSSDSPLSNFYLGAFGNNQVDDGEVHRYREYYSLPGFEINEIAARRFARVLAEVNLPPLRFRGLGTAAFFLKNLRTTIFAGALLTNKTGDQSSTYQSLGGQVALNFTLIHRLPMTMSVGYAKAFRGGKKHGSEFMISLKIL